MSYANRETSVSSGAPFELYKFQTEGQAWFLTSGDKARIFQGQQYDAVTISRTNPSMSNEEKGGHITITIPESHAIARLFVAYLPSTPLSIIIYRGHEGEAESEMQVFFTGRAKVGQFTTSDTCELDCAPDMEVLKRSIATQVFQKPCNRILFDEGCGVVQQLYRITAHVASVSADGLTVKAPEFATKEDGWFATGYIEAGTDRRMIISHTGDTIVLMNALNGLFPGQSIFAYAGCDRTYETCQARFHNGEAFMGWEWIPAQNPFSSGAA